MTDFCIQIHPDRVADLDLARVRLICEEVAADGNLVRRFTCLERPADGGEPRHVNLIFDTERPVDLWNVLRARLYESESLGRPMQIASMAMCEGEHGWRDYLLLYHYDPRERLNRFGEQPKF